jgi:hypothetical protein
MSIRWQSAVALGAVAAASLITSSSMPQATTDVQVSTDPQQLSVVGLPCFPGILTLTMTNTSGADRYADLTLDPSGPLQLSRELFSSWLPAVDPDQPVSAPVEVRVPPYAAVQAIGGGTHTRGTPRAVIETDPETWIALATGELSWSAAVASGRVHASGERADLSAYLPLEGTPARFPD